MKILIGWNYHNIMKQENTKMDKEKLRYTLWECQICEDKFTTDSKSRHDMVWCKCKKTAVDAEEWYSRFVGKPKLLKESNTKIKQ